MERNFVNPAATVFVLAMCIAMPLSTLRALAKMKNAPARPAISRRQLYLRTILGISLITMMAIIVAIQSYIILFAPWHPSLIEVSLGILLLVVAFVLRDLLAPWMRKVSPTSNQLRMPQTGRQLALWGCVSIVAGVGEEIIYRGVLFDCLWWAIHSAALAAVITAVVFAIMHFSQGLRSGLFIFILALCIQVLVWIAGSLYMAMIVHAVFDFAVGLLYLVRSRKGIVPNVAQPVSENSAS